MLVCLQTSKKLFFDVFPLFLLCFIAKRNIRILSVGDKEGEIIDSVPAKSLTGSAKTAGFAQIGGVE